MAAKNIVDNWGTRSGNDRRQQKDPDFNPDRRRRTERRSGCDRRKIRFIERRTLLDLRCAFRDF